MFQSNKKKIIIIIIIWLLLIGVTVGITIYLFNNKSINNEKNLEANYNEMSYYSFYDENDLKIEKKKYNEKDIYNYVQIKGLKNKKIENKINDEIYNTLKQGINKGAKTYYTSVYLNAFNILSLELNINYMSDDIKDERHYLNYDLTTGNKIKFEDLFTNTANISSIVYGGCYDKLSSDYSFKILSLNREIEGIKRYNEDGDPGQFYGGRTLEVVLKELKEYQDKLDDVENLAVSYSRQMINNKDKEFLITNYGIILMDKDLSEYDGRITLRSRDNMEYMAYYQKYMKKKTIYEKDNVGMTNLFLSGVNNKYLTYNKVEKVQDYGLIDYRGLFWSEVNDEEINFVNSRIEEYKKKFDKNKFNYLVVDSSHAVDNKTGIEGIEGRFQLYTMDKEDYNNKYSDVIYLNKEYEDGFYNTYRLGDYFKEEIYTSENILYADGKRYEKVEDIFVPGFDYQGYLITKYYEIKHMDIDEVNIEELKKEFKFSFGVSSNVYVYIHYLGNNQENNYKLPDLDLNIGSVDKEYLSIIR